MPKKNPLLKMTPEAFERYVRDILKREKVSVQDLTVTHLENVVGSDGEYEMDIVATFRALGDATFRCLIECKRYSNPIEREKVMILQQKLQSTGSHKGMIYSTSRFQSGAIKFAKKHGIALVYVQEGMKRLFIANSKGDDAVKIVFDSWTAELMTEESGHRYPYL